jgi:undecaprenyl-diphosphatase
MTDRQALGVDDIWVLAPLALGTLALGIAIAFIVPILYRRMDIVLRISVAGFSALLVSSLLQSIVSRPRPEELLAGVTPHMRVVGFSFPATIASVILATALVTSIYLPRIYRRWMIYLAMLLGCSGIILGVSMPLDTFAGWVVGFFCYAFILIAMGSPVRRISADFLAKKIRNQGLEDLTLKPASVDARGSVPFFGEAKGKKVFVKVFNQDNNAADWLFKLVRRIQYRRLEDEVPSLTPKRAIEHEAYLTMLAKYNAKARVPEVLGIYRVGANSYAMATEMIDSTGLDKMEPKDISDKTLDDIWVQIKKLHQHNIIHKDLRAANVMVQSRTGMPWIIDFGFSECAVQPKSFYKDNVEFIASSATKVGARRAVAAGRRALTQKSLAQALPYMQYAALSGATTTDLKLNKGLIEDIRKEMLDSTDIDSNGVAKAKISRISYPKKFTSK